jgi:hypothetical protein
MKVEHVFENKDNFKKIKKVIIELHEIKYEITSDFKGLKIKNDCGIIKIIPNGENEIIIS